MGGPPWWSSPSLNLARQFRWIFSSENLKPEFNCKVKIDSANKAILVEAYSVIEPDGTDKFFAWVRAMERNRHSQDTYRMEEYDGCGRTIHWMEFDGVSLVGWQKEFDYASSEVATTKVYLTFQSYRSPEVECDDAEIVVGDTRFVIDEATPLWFKVCETKLPTFGTDVYLPTATKWEPVTISLKNKDTEALLELLHKHDKAELRCKGNRYLLEGLYPCVRRGLVQISFRTAQLLPRVTAEERSPHNSRRTSTGDTPAGSAASSP